MYLVRALMIARGEVVELAQQAATHEERKVEEAALRERAREIESSREELLSYFLQFNDPAPLLEMVERTGASLNLDVEIVSVIETTLGGSKDVKGERAGRLAVKVGGSWDACYSFAERIEHLPYAVAVEAVTLSKGESDRWSGEITFYVLGI